MTRDALTSGEIAYVRDQRIGRLATIDADGAPQVNPVSVYVNPALGSLDIGGSRMAESRKYRNVQRGSAAAVVIDDLAGPRGIRCLEIRGNAVVIAEPRDSAARSPGPIIRIWPRRIISWGIDPPALARGARDVTPRGESSA